MTTIYLLTQGQQLINASKVVVASGDVDSVQLHVEFDSAEWKAYPTRSATFYTSNDSTVHEKLLVSNKCIVPFEVLQESGVLFIGVRGVSSDGERVKTSTLVKYKISEGAVAGDKTLNPSMDLYQQYLAALKNEATPVIEAMKSEVEKAIETEIQALRDEAVETNEAARAMLEALQGKELWKNQNPTTEFPATTIELDLSAYKRFNVVYFTNNNESLSTYRVFEEKIISIKGEKYRLTSDSFADSNNSTYRDITISDTEIVISTSKPNDSDKLFIPVKIVGYKY